jgi:tryptophan-rich sensory protein
MKMFFQQKYLWLIAAWMVTTSVLGGLATKLGPWYFSLIQPPWKPPDWAFGIVWTTIFILSALAWMVAFNGGASQSQKNKIMMLFWLNGFFNVLWSVLYFRLQHPDWSMIEAFFLWGSVLAIILVMWPIRRLAAYLMLPYLIWVTIAMRLNWETLVLNPGAY